MIITVQRSHRSGLILSMLFLLVAAACARPNAVLNTRYGIRTFVTTTARSTANAEYFKREWAEICKKRGLAACNGERPSKQIGLAFSGGGIRSNAFQLGIMSGLTGTPSEQDYMKKVDYISAVSGGTWAAGAYKVYGCNRKDGALVSCDTTTSLFDRIEEDLRSGGRNDRFLLSGYAELMKDVKKSIWFYDWFDLNEGYTVRESWRSMIVRHFLESKDVRLAEMQGGGNMRPLVIFNATHDQVSSPEKSFPFEMSAFSVGTIADCGNTRYCDDNSLRLASYGTDVAVFCAPATDCLPPLYMSHAMAASSGVLPRSFGYLKWSLRYPRPLSEDAQSPDNEKERYGSYRNNYELTDGGQSENLGALALMERHVDLIVISDIDHDPSYEFGDYHVLESQAEQLLEICVEAGDGSCRGTKDDKAGKQQSKNYNQKSDRPDPIKDFAFRSPSEFVEAEFTGSFTVEGLYNALAGDIDGVPIDREHAYTLLKSIMTHTTSPAIMREELNTLLAVNNFYDLLAKIFIKRNQPIPLSRDAERLIEETKPYRGTPYRDLWKPQQDRIYRLNRLVIEAAYDGKCPRSDYHILQGDYRVAEGRIGSILLIKPPRQIDRFKQYLRDHHYDDVHNYLEFNSQAVDFPTDGTFKESYDPRLIQAYYLLGKYISTEYLRREIDAWEAKQ